MKAKTHNNKQSKNGKITRASGAPANTKKPAKKTAKAKTTQKSPKITVLGHTLTSFCRGLGNAGWKAGDAVIAIQRVAPKAPEVTIRTQVSKAKFSPAMKLKGVELKEMRKLVKAA